LLAAAVGKLGPTGASRFREQDRCKALAGSSTLNRLELTLLDANSGSRYKKTRANFAGMDALMVSLALESEREAPKQIWLDLDATDDPLHGKQGGRFFGGYYGHYWWQPLHISWGEDLLCALLRRSNIEASEGSV
jgi:Transposase DDE domain group 1